MSDLNVEKARTPQGIFLIYVIVSGILIIIFRFIWPGAEPPLLLFSREWRMVQGWLEFFNLFPALALSSLVIPFGIVSIEEEFPSFSQIFFKRLFASVVAAICAAVIYAMIFFLAYPMVKNNEENMLFKGELYQLAKIRAQECNRTGDWEEASQFISICDRIWPNSKELETLREQITANLTKLRSEESRERSLARESLAREWRGADILSMSGDPQPVDASHAISMGEAAFDAQRYFDAHWFAVLGERIAVRGSPEAASAARLASESWNKIESQSPNQREERLYSLYDLKLSGYRAMNASNWIAAYYIFLELSSLTPDDPDVKKFLATSERGTKAQAFFMDEMELYLGEILTGAVFSLPGEYGRTVLRFSSLSMSKDFAYGIGLEYMEFDGLSRPMTSVRSSYAKLLPIVLNGKSKVMVLTHALDRNNKDISTDAEWLLGKKQTEGVMLDISFEDLLLLFQVRYGLPNLQINELFAASEKFGNAGYISEIFEAEVLNRLSSAVFFMPMAIIVIIIAWRYRAKTRPRYFFVILLPVLPIVFHGFVFLYRSFLNTLGIWLVLSIGFSAALAVLIVILALSMFFSLIVLAAQHG